MLCVLRARSRDFIEKPFVSAIKTIDHGSLTADIKDRYESSKYLYGCQLGML